MNTLKLTESLYILKPGKQMDSGNLLSHEELKTKYNIETNFLQTIQKLKNSNLAQVSRNADIKIKVYNI